ncbi:MmgE/PrpD family protein [Mesorhizobium sp. M0910]|uniref:MmgE/PrpD family protein n=1 Tax=Mesorhizobium sp. M0910 TaxID=2957025 RepID=UPI003335E03D
MWSAEKLAGLITEFDPSVISQATRGKVSDLVIDVVGAAAAGVRTEAAAATRAVCQGLFSPGLALCWFTDKRLSPAAAAFANSAAAVALDIDDGHRRAIGHPGAAIIPAMIAEAEASDASSEELLAAIVIGYEAGIRVASAQSNRQDSRLYATGRWAPVAVAAGLGFLRRLDRARLTQALAIAATHRPAQLPSGTSKQLGHAKEGIAWASFTGFVAVDLAQNGFTASLDIFDIPELFDGSALHRDWGELFEIERTYTKPYSCCRWIHAAIDALRIIMDREAVQARDISRVEVHTIGPAVRLNNKPDPSAHFEAQFSVPFCLAVAAIEGSNALVLPDTAVLHRSDLISFARKVDLRIDPQLDALFPARTSARLVVETRSGVYEHQVDFPKGEPDNAMTRSELLEKFERLCTFGHGPSKAARLVTAFAILDDRTLDNVTQHISEIILPT